MSNDDDTRELPPRLPDINNTGKKIEEGVEKLHAGEIDFYEFQELVSKALPRAQDFGMETDDDKERAIVNTVPAPENPDCVVYFYEDDDKTPRMVIRYPNYKDNHVFEEGAKFKRAESLGVDLVSHIQNEHIYNIQYELISNAMVSKPDAQLNTEEEEIDPEDQEYLKNLDPETRAAILKHKQ